MHQDFSGRPPSQAHKLTLGELAERAIPVPGTMKCTDVERLLVRHNKPASLIAIRSDGTPLLVDRLSFLHLMAGPIGYGRMLYNERPVQAVLAEEPLVLSAGTTVATAFEHLLARNPHDRFHDLVVEYPDGSFGLLQSSLLLERVAEFNADAALHDPLTGLGNRTRLMDTIHQALDCRTVWLALLFIDLDRFKVVNDGLGHDAGDTLLTAIAERIGRVVRDRGLAARLGGDEFAVAIQGRTEVEVREVAELLATETIDVVRGPVRLGERLVVTSASAGIALAGPGDDPSSVLRRADIAMYQAKRAGGGQFRVFRGDQDAAAKQRLDLEIWLRHAFERRELSVVYQPIVQLGTGRLQGFEALIRGVHAELGPLCPSDFLPVAEEIGLMPEIDAWVLEQGLAQLARWHQRGAVDIRLAINLSAQTLGRPQSLDRFEVLWDRAGVSPEHLVFEVTESEALGDISTTTELLGGMRALGARVAIDDFGTGYSSLAQLATLPLDVLKIDRTFVQHLGSGHRNEEMVRIIVALAQGLRAATVAEGVELPEQASALRAMGCESGQGFLYAPALSPERALAEVDRSQAAGLGKPLRAA